MTTVAETMRRKLTEALSLAPRVLNSFGHLGPARRNCGEAEAEK